MFDRSWSTRDRPGRRRGRIGPRHSAQNDPAKQTYRVIERPSNTQVLDRPVCVGGDQVPQDRSHAGLWTEISNGGIAPSGTSGWKYGRRMRLRERGEMAGHGSSSPTCRCKHRWTGSTGPAQNPSVGLGWETLFAYSSIAFSMRRRAWTSPAGGGGGRASPSDIAARAAPT